MSGAEQKVWTGGADCPHCKAFANFVQAARVEAAPSISDASFPRAFYHLMQCQRCAGIIFVVLDSENRILDQYPAMRTEAPLECPQDVRDNYKEALGALNKGLWKAAVMMARSSLQAAMRGQGASGKNLQEEIDDLARRHVITPYLQEWAHEVRLGGNLVAHPEPGKRLGREDAEEIIDFADSLLHYMYVMPKRVEERRSRFGGEASAGTG